MGAQIHPKDDSRYGFLILVHANDWNVLLSRSSLFLSSRIIMTREATVLPQSSFFPIRHRSKTFPTEFRAVKFPQGARD